MTYKPDLCIHHSPCQDGFAAAWAVWKRWPDTEFHPGVYGQDPPDVTGKHVLLVDFSYKRPVLEEMSRTAATITILDHHKTAEADLETYAILNGVNAETIEATIAATQPGLGAIRAQFDMTQSGAHLAWAFCHPGAPIPRLIRYVEDRDLWRFDLDDTREIAADLFSRPYEFGEFSEFATQLESREGRDLIVAGGEAIERKHHKDVGELLDLTMRYMVIGGLRVPVANIPYFMASDAAHILAEGNPFGACYFDRGDGQRQFSLRSQPGGADVSLIAKAYGGGGHEHAAGFQVPIGWEGDHA
jgi:oligoribonuclease NrnB/cAMP/cGMP phosphodiesterase (DHH superfamily)